MILSGDPRSTKEVNPIIYVISPDWSGVARFKTRAEADAYLEKHPRASEVPASQVAKAHR